MQTERLTSITAAPLYEFVPELSEWKWVGGRLSGEATLSFSDEGIETWNFSHVAGEKIALQSKEVTFSCEKLGGHLSIEGGELDFSGGEWEVLSLQGSNWSGKAIWVEGALAPSRFSGQIGDKEASFELFGQGKKWSGKAELASFLFENVKMEWEPQPGGFSIMGMSGDWVTPRGNIGFDCPILSKEGNRWTFDLRLKRQTWDLIRLAGISNREKVFFDANKSHFLGTPFQSECLLSETGGLEKCDIQIRLPWQSG